MITSSSHSAAARYVISTRDAAPKETIERIKGMRFGKDGYYTDYPHAVSARQNRDSRPRIRFD
jgi:hypothetical protein